VIKIADGPEWKRGKTVEPEVSRDLATVDRQAKDIIFRDYTIRDFPSKG